ncbi:hypothetical protein FKG94_03090 [Exilibacterium tricleocarpae]|uniref:Uncharacterized protein n=1 Tax=Exilibacterium tricleocarpae TaxID=2591008 RepID=A0A545U6T9_9GAMM|nr:hypothetical protein [Exilibacterium tricleocarpae]TQV85189.1 hypothetical protein FKG94_03090 [Exilibacterium tricleocarpae]
MAYFEGSVIGHNALIDRLLSIVTGVELDVAMNPLPVNERWTVLADTEEGGSLNERHVYLRAPGSPGGAQPFLQLRRIESVAADWFNIGISAATGYSSASSFFNQPNHSGEVFWLLINSAINYRIKVNGRHLTGDAQVMGSFEPMYMGFGLPSVFATNYPFPMFIGANHGVFNARWSASDFRHLAFFQPGAGCAKVYHFDGSWVDVLNRNISGSPTAGTNVWPWAGTGLMLPAPQQLRPGMGGTYRLWPATVHGNTGVGQNYMTLEGVYFVTGFSNGPANTLAGNQYFVTQAATRSDFDMMAAIQKV